jgi:hypothetical protein
MTDEEATAQNADTSKGWHNKILVHGIFTMFPTKSPTIPTLLFP